MGDLRRSYCGNLYLILYSFEMGKVFRDVKWNNGGAYSLSNWFLKHSLTTLLRLYVCQFRTPAGAGARSRYAAAIFRRLYAHCLSYRELDMHVLRKCKARPHITTVNCLHVLLTLLVDLSTAT